jgi:hypothetical protein
LPLVLLTTVVLSYEGEDIRMFRISGLGQSAWNFCLLLNGEIHVVEIQLLCSLGSVYKAPQVLSALLSGKSYIKVSVN